jgi:hypothetical protein
MNSKTYCPLGKINCERRISENCRDAFPNPNYTTYEHLGKFETCPWPSKQQKIERYDLCEDQPAQIRCWQQTCQWYRLDMEHNGKCRNISPAITLHSNILYGESRFTCHSFKEKP